MIPLVVSFLTAGDPNTTHSNGHVSADDWRTPPDSVFHIGEELTYNVSYLSFDIGRVRVKLVDTFTHNHQTLYRAVAYIDSYRGVPFVDLHSVYETHMEPSIHSRWFMARNKKNDRWRSYTCIFDYPNRSLVVEEGFWKSSEVTKRDTVVLDTLYQDGLSILFFARKHVFDQKRLTEPTIIRDKKGTTFLDFVVEQTKDEIDAVDYPIDLVHFEGEAGFVGIFGLTGGFEGWFTNDAARVPVLAKMHVIIGSIKIELIDWKRNGWMPPKYVEETGDR